MGSVINYESHNQKYEGLYIVVSLDRDNRHTFLINLFDDGGCRTSSEKR